MAEMVEFGKDAAVVPENANPTAATKVGGFLKGLKDAGHEQMGKAVKYAENAASGLAGPWEPPGKDWPSEWTDKEPWYPRIASGRVDHSLWLTRSKKEAKHSKGPEMWATTHRGSFLGVWYQDCPKSCFDTVIGYLFPVSAVALCVQRRKLLVQNDKSYECCAGLWGPSFTLATTRCTKDQEPCCMFAEALFCPLCALRANRWMVQSHYQLEDTCLDGLIVDAGSCCREPGQICCGCPEFEELAIIFALPFFGCLYAQHEHEMRTSGFPFLGRQPGDVAMNYHMKCSYGGHVIVKKVLPHPHEHASMT
ncbi:hypothetical protein DIPPA_10232 [Diplonema papillatum]|nr:hypothetical protein DIPPA_10232 [Diplonema papillatum]